MYRIRFHGRGGHGMKTASRILGTALFIEGFEVQDAPRYGAERRGAPIFAYVRASKKTIYERGIINNPDLVIVADDSLIPIPVADILNGIRPETVILINSRETSETWIKRLNAPSTIITLPIVDDIQDRATLPYIGVACAGAGAKIMGTISRESLEQAIKEELAPLGNDVIQKNINQALATYDLAAKHTDIITTEGKEASATNYQKPDWITLPFDNAEISAPIIHTGLTSVEIKTGLWRTMRPIIDTNRCNHCWWLCSSFCPDGAINVNNGIPDIDYDYCKGCMVCMAQCPPHAIESVPESGEQDKKA